MTDAGGKPINCTVTVDADRVAKMEIGDRLYQGPINDDPLASLVISRVDRLAQLESSRTKSPVPPEAEQAEFCEQEDLRLLGQALFRLLFEGGDAKEITLAKSGERFEGKPVVGRHLGKILCDALAENRKTPVRLNLVFDQKLASLAQNPWEFLYLPSGNGEGFFAASEEATLSITRIIRPKVQTHKPGSPLKLWIAWAAPKDLGKIADIDLIIPTIKAKLGQRGDVASRVLEDVTWETLQSALNDAETDRPDIFHFIGHGKLANDKSVIALKRNKESMAAERAKSRNPDYQPSDVDWCDISNLAAQLKRAPPWLFFLQTCKSASHDTRVEGARSAAQQIANADVPFVVAMQYEIENDDAKSFTEVFYDRLGRRESIDLAVRGGRIWLGRRTPSWGHPRFATPVVYLRSDEQGSDEQVLASTAAPVVPSKDEQWCPYKCQRLLVDLNSRECACEKNKPVKYCVDGHANRIDVQVCINRRCPAKFDEPAIVAISPPAASADRGVAAAPIEAPRDKGLA